MNTKHLFFMQKVCNDNNYEMTKYWCDDYSASHGETAVCEIRTLKDGSNMLTIDAHIDPTMIAVSVVLDDRDAGESVIMSGHEYLRTEYESLLK